MQVFAWLATMRRGRLRLDGGGIFLLGFLFIFVLGGLTGVMVAVLPFDWQVHDTYFVVAHFHYVLIGGLVFPMFAALVHWTPLLNGQRLRERAQRWSFWMCFGGFNLAFFPMHVAGLLGMPRRVYTYDAGLGWTGWNLASSAGAAVFAAGAVLLLAEALRTWLRPQRPHDNPWRAGTLEWLPAGDYGARSIPQVASRDPLWASPTLPAEVEQGRHWLPGTVTGRRETLVTSWRHAQPRHLIALPGDGWLPVIAGLGTAGFFLLLTVKSVALAWGCAAVAVAALLRWLWASDRYPGPAAAEVAQGVTVPVGASGVHSHSWWGTLVLVVVDLTIFAALVFAHLHVSMQAAVCPPPGAALPPAQWSLVTVGAWLATATAVLGMVRVPPQARAAVAGLTALALLGLAAASAASFTGHLHAGLSPRADAWSATVAALLAWQMLHALVLATMGGYLIARAGAGLLTPRHHATRDNVALLWFASAAQGVIATLVVARLPQWLG